MGRCCYNGAGGELPSDEWGVAVVVIFSPGNLEQLKKPDDGSKERKAGQADVLFEAGLTRPACQGGAGQACRPYLSVTAAAMNFLRPVVPGLVLWAAHQSGNVAGSM